MVLTRIPAGERERAIVPMPRPKLKVWESFAGSGVLGQANPEWIPYGQLQYLIERPDSDTTVWPAGEMADLSQSFASFGGFT